MIDEQLRSDALKMAFEVAFKIDAFNSWQTPAMRFKNLKEVFELAELNIKFVKGEPISLEK